MKICVSSSGTQKKNSGSVADEMDRSGENTLRFSVQDLSFGESSSDSNNQIH